jgi:hypothetical protein
MEFGPMNVQVKILVSSQPTEEDLGSMKSAAEKLTNARKSIAVSMQKSDRHFELIADFTMRRTAQYAVVSDISQEFEFWTHSLNDYEDMTICFP